MVMNNASLVLYIQQSKKHSIVVKLNISLNVMRLTNYIYWSTIRGKYSKIIFSRYKHFHNYF